MAYSLEGWLEVRRGGEQGEPVWAGVVRLGPLLDVADAVSGRFCGLSKGLTSSIFQSASPEKRLVRSRARVGQGLFPDKDSFRARHPGVRPGPQRRTRAARRARRSNGVRSFSR